MGECTEAWIPTQSGVFLQSFGAVLWPDFPLSFQDVKAVSVCLTVLEVRALRTQDQNACTVHLVLEDT